MTNNGGFSLFESRVGVAVWSVALCYGMYSTYLGSKSFSNMNPDKCETAPGWFLDLRVDRTYEWNITLLVLKKGFVWWCLNLIGAEIVRKNSKEFLAWWYLGIGFVFITYSFDISVALFFLAHPIVFFILMRAKSRLLLWFVSIVCYSNLFVVYLNFSPPKAPDVVDVIAGEYGWIVLKCLSYCLDGIDLLTKPTLDRHVADKDLSKEEHADRKQERSQYISYRLPGPRQFEVIQLNQSRGILLFLAYTFYVPLLVGPIIVYEEFEIGMAKRYQPWSATRIFNITLNIFRYLGWALFFDIVKHFIHYNCMVKNPESINGLNSWALFGLMYHVGFDFMMVYVVLYGLPSVFARAEQFNVPSHPICGAHVQMPTKMWRYFDRGLYLFLIKYIYIPLIDNRKDFGRKLMASFVTFSFIFMFHGIHMFVFIWSLYNFIAITLEATARAIGSTKIYQQWEVKWLSPLNARRIYMVMMTPLEIVALVANMYYIGSSERFGHAISARILTLDWKDILFLAVLSFCRGQTTRYFEKYGKSL